MYFVEEQYPPVRLLDQSFAITVRACIGSAHGAKEVRHQQLWIVGVIRAVETNKWRVGG